MNIGDYWTQRGEQPAPKGISELLASAGPEINDHVIALHREIADLREVLRTTQAQMQAERSVIDGVVDRFEKVLATRAKQVDSLREARRHLKAQVRHLQEQPGRPEEEWPQPRTWLRMPATHNGRPCEVIAVDGSYAWVLYHPAGRPRTAFRVEVDESP